MIDGPTQATTAAPSSRAERSLIAVHCRQLATRVQMRVDAMLERDGSEVAAITGRGIWISFLLTGDILSALTHAADELDAAAPRPPAAMDYTAMQAGDMLQALGDDAAKWAAAFCQHAKGLGHDLDEGWMIGWFANAIEHSSDVRRRQKPVAAHAALLARLGEPEMREAVRKAVSAICERKVGTIFPYGSDLVAMMDALADAALAVITEKLT